MVYQRKTLKEEWTIYKKVL